MKTYNYICLDCGKVFNESEFDSRRDEECCPNCQSLNIDDAVICGDCGEYVAVSKSYDGYCEECVSKKATAENVVNYCDDEKTDVEINFGAVSILKALGFDINEVVTAYALDVAKVFHDKAKVKAAIENCIKCELDVAHFMKGATAL